MSEANVEVVRKARDASNGRDPVAFLACLSPDVEWEESGDVLPGLRGVYRGRADVRRWFEEAVTGPWDSFCFKEEEEEIREASDDRVFTEMVATARGRASGLDTELRLWQVFWLTDGKIAKRRVFWTRHEALEAAGLSE